MFEKWAEKFKEKSQENEITFKEYPENPVAIEPEREEPAQQKQASLKADLQEGGSNIELKVVRPESYGEVGTIADYLLANCTVVINFEVLFIIGVFSENLRELSGRDFRRAVVVVDAVLLLYDVRQLRVAAAGEAGQ